MIEKIKGQLWYCCEDCGKRLVKLSEGAFCSGLILKCKRCGQEKEITIIDGKSA